jgi:type I restriction enzyme R subunit
MSKKALNSEQVRAGLKELLLGPVQLYAALRARGEARRSIP